MVVVLNNLFIMCRRVEAYLLNLVSSYKVGEVCNWRRYQSFNPIKVKIIEVYFDEYRGFSYEAICVDETLPDYYGFDVWCKLKELSKLEELSKIND